MSEEIDFMRHRMALIDGRMDRLEERLNGIETELLRGEKSLLERIGEIQSALANLQGRLIGYLAAATVLGGVILFIAQLVFGHLVKH